MRHPRVALLGYYGYQNAGDEWLLGQSKAVIRQAWPAAEFRVISRKTLGSVLPVLWWCDRLILGGGSLFQDKSSRLSVIFYASVCVLAMVLRKPVIILANGIGPLSTEMGRWIMRRMAPRFHLVIARDPASYEMFKQFGVPKEKLRLTGDLAFFAEPGAVSQDSRSILPVLGAQSAIGINLRPTPFFNRLKAALSHLPFSVRVGVMAHYQQDPGTVSRVFPNMERHWLPLEVSDAKRQPPPCQAVIAMRFHVLVWAAWHRLPVVAIADDDKTANFARELGIPLIDLRALNYETQAKTFFHQLFSEPMPPEFYTYSTDPFEARLAELPEVLRRDA